MPIQSENESLLDVQKRKIKYSHDTTSTLPIVEKLANKGLFNDIDMLVKLSYYMNSAILS